MRGFRAVAVVLGICGTLAFAAAGEGANANANYRAVCPATPDGAHCHALVVTDAEGNPNATSGPTGYGPAQFHGAYGLPATASTAQTIAIVDAYDDPNIESDLGVYDQQFGLPACTTANGCFQKVDQNGGTSYPTKNSGWDLEIALDVETAHQTCQNCKVILVEASSNSLANLGAAENTAARLGANVISNSYGGNEYSGEVSDSSTYFNHPGVAITVSSGDSGYGVEFPAASQYVTAVGGTTLRLTSGNARSSETAWSSAGSGCSAYIAKPSWQTDGGCSRRTVADVSADADPNTGAAVYDSVRYQGQRGWFQVGGTSLAAPLVAGVYALAGNAGSVNYGSYPYSHTSSLFDVTSGSNGSCGSYLCNAGAGFDGPTGLGTPNGTGGF
jgi:subtilase family serine protease